MNSLVSAAAGHPVLVALVAVALWFGFHLWKRRSVDARFGIKISGGRGGIIAIHEHGRTARAEYEVGTTADLIVYERSMVEANGEQATLARRAEN